MIEIGDCNECGSLNVPVRHMNVAIEGQSGEWGWDYCEQCWIRLSPDWETELGEPVPKFSDA